MALVQISQKELEDFLGAPISAYDSCPVGERDLSPLGQHERVIHPIPVLNALLKYGINPRLKELVPARNTSVNTGEVWQASYNQVVLYWAPIEGRGDSVIILGGDTYDHAKFVVFGKDDMNCSLEEIIFSPFNVHA